MDDAKRLRSLEKEEYRKLKKLLAASMLDHAVLKELLKKMVRPAAKREAIAHLRKVLG
jgi:hypothetical protein